MRRGFLLGLLAVTLTACSSSSQSPTLSPLPERAPSPTSKVVASEDLAAYDDSAEHSDNLELVASLARQAPLNTEAALGTDLAFTGDYAIAGNYEGFTIYDIARPESPSIASQVYCPGVQNDVTVSGDLLFLSVDAVMDGPSCQAATLTSPGTGWEGVRIFDIKDKSSPRYVASVATPCGSHTATLVPGPSPDAVYLYSSSAVGRGADPACVEARGKISVLRVPVADPAAAKLVATPVLMADGGTAIDSRFASGGCHDITVFAAKAIAAAACIGDGLLLDISDPEKPEVLDRIQDKEHFGYWHSATFNHDASKVVFADEFGGGLSNTCDPKTPPGSGSNGIYTLAGNKLKIAGYFKIPRPALAPKTCSAHNGSLLPVKGRDIMVQAWYEAGVSVIDFTDPAKAKEIAFFQRGKSPYSSPDEFGGSWSAYFYNGHIYSSDIFKGLDVLKLSGVPFENTKLKEFNAQTQ